MADTQPNPKPEAEAPPANKHAPNFTKIGWGTLVAGTVLGLLVRTIVGSVTGAEINLLWSIVGGFSTVGAGQLLASHTSVSVAGSDASRPSPGITVHPQFQRTRQRQRQRPRSLPAGIEDVPDGTNVAPPDSPGMISSQERNI